MVARTVETVARTDEVVEPAVGTVETVKPVTGTVLMVGTVAGTVVAVVPLRNGRGRGREDDLTPEPYTGRAG